MTQKSSKTTSKTLENAQKYSRKKTLNLITTQRRRAAVCRRSRRMSSVDLPLCTHKNHPFKKGKMGKK
jgi:hypothetical protein